MNFLENKLSRLPPNNNHNHNNNNLSTIRNNQKFYLKVAYFCSFVARGSLLPFLGVILHSSRNSSLLMIGVTTNVGAISRVATSIFFATSLDNNNNTNNNKKKNTASDITTGSNNNIGKLKTILLTCVWITAFFSFIFTICPDSPNLSALSVACLLCASSIGSLVLDSLTIKMFHHRHQDDENDAISRTQDVQEEDEDDDARQKTAIKTRKNNNNKSGDQASAEYGKVRLFGSIGWGIAAPMQVALMSFLYNSNTNPSSATTTSPDMKAWFPDRVVVGGGGGGQQNSSSSPKTPMFGTIIIFILATMGFTAAIKLVPSSSSNMISRNNVEYSTRSSVHDDESENDDDDERDRLVEVADVNRSTTTTPSNDDHELQSVATTKSATTTSKAENDEETSKMKPAVLKNNNKKRTEQLLSLIWSLRSVLLLAVLYGICDDSLSTFLFPFLRSDLNVPSKILGIIPTVNVLSELPVLYLTGWFNKKFSIYALHALYLFLWVVRFSWYSFVLVPNDDGNKNSTSAVVSTTSTTVVPSSIINSPISTNVAETNEQGWIPSYSPELHHQLVSSFKILSIETLNGLCFAGAFVLLMRHTVTLSSSTSDSNSKKSDDEQSNRQHEDSSTGDDKNYKNNDEDNVHQTIPLVHSAFFGVASMIVGLGGGGLAQRFGVRMLFSLEALICFLVALMILCVVVWRKAG